MPGEGIAGRLLVAYIRDENGELTGDAEVFYDIGSDNRVQLTDLRHKHLGKDTIVDTDINFSKHTATNLREPTAASDAATKNYTDTSVSNLRKDVTERIDTVEKEYKAADAAINKELDSLNDRVVQTAIPFGVCDTAVGNPAKKVSLDRYHVDTDEYILVEFTNGCNPADVITLQVNSEAIQQITNYDDRINFTDVLPARSLVLFKNSGGSWYCQSVINYERFLNLDGGTMLGDIDLNHHQLKNADLQGAEIHDLKEPIADSDAATKKYADDQDKKKEDRWSSVTTGTDIKLQSDGSKDVTINGGTGSELTLGTKESHLKNGNSSVTADSNGKAQIKGASSVDVSVGSTSVLSAEADADGNVGDLNVHTRKITNVKDPTAAQDAATKKYVDDHITNATNGSFKADGSVPMTGDLNVNNHNITNVAEPTVGTDAANKEYVDTQFNSLNNFVIDDNGGTGYQDLDTLYMSHSAGKIGTIYLVNLPAAEKAEGSSYAEYFWTGKAYEVFQGSPAPNVIVKDGSVPMAGDLNLADHKVTHLKTPTDDYDAATKEYVDSALKEATGFATDDNGGSGYASLDDLNTKVPAGQAGTIYFVQTNPTEEGNNFKEYIWGPSGYEELGEPIPNMEDYATKEDLAKVQNSAGVPVLTCNDSEVTARSVTDDTFTYSVGRYFIISFTYGGDVNSLSINGKSYTVATDSYPIGTLPAMASTLFYCEDDTSVKFCGNIGQNFVAVVDPLAEDNNTPILMSALSTTDSTSGNAVPASAYADVYFDWGKEELHAPRFSGIMDDGEVVTVRPSN